MATIVEYTDRKQPRNHYPERIISPPQSSPCCFTNMEEIGTPEANERWEYRFKRCRACGFTVRVIVRELPNVALARDLRRILENSFVRNVPD